jgi:hypothetical protein
MRSIKRVLNCCGLTCLHLILLYGPLSWAQQAGTVSPSGATLTADQIAQKLEEKNQERFAALRQFEGTRVYRMQYRGFPGNRDAEMVVSLTYRSPDSKEFTVVSQTGSKLILDRVFKKLLESEREAASEENRQRTALNRRNYDFTFDRVETDGDGSRYVLGVLPRTNNKFLYRGKIWVDAKDFAVTKIEAEPAKNPSFWIKKSSIEHKYTKLDGLWLPSENHSESWTRLGGRASLSIEYKDYKITEARPVGPNQDAMVVGSSLTPE